MSLKKLCLKIKTLKRNLKKMRDYTLNDLKKLASAEGRLLQDAKVMVVVKNAFEKTVAKVEDYRERL